MNLEDIFKVIKRMRNRDNLKMVADAASARIRAIEAAEKEREFEALVEKDPRHKLDPDDPNHPKYDNLRDKEGWPGPGWVWGRRGWRQLGAYDG